MSNFSLGKSSLKKLEGVNPVLVKVVKRAIQITSQDFSVVEGVRSLERQRTLFDKGKSRTMSSRHLTGHAVDILPYPFNGDIDGDGIPNVEDWDQYYPLADAMISASKELDVALRWGGNWGLADTRVWAGSGKALARAYTGKFNDGPHFELARGFYP